MSAIERYVDWCRNTALPFWSQRAWDRRSGGFLESLSLDGSPVSGDSRRLRTQARQVYVFARAHLAGWCDGYELAVDGYALMEQRAKAPDGRDGWVHRLTDSGEVENPTRDLYDHAFVLLALAWLYRLTRDPRYRRDADALFTFLDRTFASPHGGYEESRGGAPLPRRQNPHMHLFECMLSWHEVTGDDHYLDRAMAVLGLLETRFVDPVSGFLREFFDAEWRTDFARYGDVVEPGHELEWVCLLDAFRRVGRAVPAGLSDRLYRHANEFGLNADIGFMMSAVTSSGVPIHAGTRTWVQTEWLRATLARVRANEAGALADAENAACQLLKWHLDPAISGGWIDSLDEFGLRSADRIPASTLYHLLGAALDADEVLAARRQTA